MDTDETTGNETLEEIDKIVDKIYSKHLERFIDDVTIEPLLLAAMRRVALDTAISVRSKDNTMFKETINKWEAALKDRDETIDNLIKINGQYIDYLQKIGAIRKSPEVFH